MAVRSAADRGAGFHVCNARRLVDRWRTRRSAPRWKRASSPAPEIYGARGGRAGREWPDRAGLGGPRALPGRPWPTCHGLPGMEISRGKPDDMLYRSDQGSRRTSEPGLAPEDRRRFFATLQKATHLRSKRPLARRTYRCAFVILEKKGSRSATFVLTRFTHEISRDASQHGPTGFNNVQDCANADRMQATK
jgi:hypothetical protein